MAVDAVPQRPPHCRKFNAKDCVAPMISPPTNVHGRLRRRPMIAAANASTMKSVSTSTRSPTVGARRIPAIAAIDDPSAHANPETRPGRTPCNAASCRSSTTARIATPVRLRYRRRRRKTATRIATTMVMNRCHVSTTSPMSIPCLSARNSGSGGAIEFSSQIVAARPMRKNMRPIVTTSFTTRGVSTRRRINAQSTNAPNSGATISTTNTIATHAGQPWLIRTSQ
jgi:hypothetical protein